MIDIAQPEGSDSDADSELDDGDEFDAGSEADVSCAKLWTVCLPVW